MKERLFQGGGATNASAPHMDSSNCRSRKVSRTLSEDLASSSSGSSRVVSPLA